jgi:hypothetical protein
MEQVVTGCKDCPMYSVDDSNDSLIVYNYCHHRSHATVTVQDIDLDKESNPITPDWCPLKREPITITFKQ